MTSILYHNPRCSKSRDTLRLLQERKVPVQVIEYLKEPPDAATLDALLQRLGLEPRQLMRTQEEEYLALGLDAAGLSRAQLIAAMVAHPKLIERPILVVGDKAAIGRPPERVLEILP